MKYIIQKLIEIDDLVENKRGIDSLAPMICILSNKVFYTREEK